MTLGEVRGSAFLLQNVGYGVIFGCLGEVFCIFTPKCRILSDFCMWVSGSAFLLRNIGYRVNFGSLDEVNHLASLLDTGTGISRTASCFSVNKLRRSCNQKSKRFQKVSAV